MEDISIEPLEDGAVEWGKVHEKYMAILKEAKSGADIDECGIKMYLLITSIVGSKAIKEATEEERKEKLYDALWPDNKQQLPG